MIMTKVRSLGLIFVLGWSLLSVQQSQATSSSRTSTGTDGVYCITTKAAISDLPVAEGTETTEAWSYFHEGGRCSTAYDPGADKLRAIVRNYYAPSPTGPWTKCVSWAETNRAGGNYSNLSVSARECGNAYYKNAGNGAFIWMSDSSNLSVWVETDPVWLSE